MQHLNFTRGAPGLGAILAACVLAASPACAQSPLLKPQEAQVALGSLPMRAMWALESNDLPTLAKLAHSKGVRISPGAFAEKDDKTFSPAQIRRLNRGTKYLWGSYDGSGDPIRLSWAAYRREFLWNHDYSKGKLSFNTFTHRGNRANNLSQAYTDAIFVESFVDSTPEPGGINWGSLWTIWKRENGTWKLRGLANDYWTT